MENNSADDRLPHEREGTSSASQTNTSSGVANSGPGSLPGSGGQMLPPPVIKRPRGRPPKNATAAASAPTTQAGSSEPRQMSMQETYAAEEMADSLNDLPRGDREQFLNEVKRVDGPASQQLNNQVLKTYNSDRFDFFPTRDHDGAVYRVHKTSGSAHPQHNNGQSAQQPEAPQQDEKAKGPSEGPVTYLEHQFDTVYNPMSK